MCKNPDLLLQHIWNICNIPLKHLKHLKHTVATCAFNSAQYLVAAWENGGSSACGVHRRQRPDGARKLRDVGGGCATRQQGNARTTRREKEPDSPGSHLRRACRADPPVARAIGAVAPPYQGPLRPPRRGPLMLRSRRGRARSCQGRCVGTLPYTATRERWKE
jgi:hypothetical protein